MLCVDHADTVKMVTVRFEAGGLEVLAYEGDREAAFDCGGEDYPIKPTDTPDLCASLYQLLAKH